MQSKFQYSDLHCHPNLKTYGHSFNRKGVNKKSGLWHYERPNLLTKGLNILLGLTKFTQADFTTLSKGGAKLIFISLYPFEKGFFINASGAGPLSASLSNLVTGIGYDRIRNLQQHTNYFQDLESEYAFVKGSQKTCEVAGEQYNWRFINNTSELEKSLETKNEIAVVLSIEGAHVFNSGLRGFGRKVSKKEIIHNIRKVKNWGHPPFYITFAHNFNNDLCGHAESLEPIKRFVNQKEGMNTGFTKLGITALHELLSSKNGKPIYIDLKHMSIRSRKDYFNILKNDFSFKMPPTMVSHGAVNGLSLQNTKKRKTSNLFYAADINFFDEEIEHIGEFGGLFAIQFDTRRIAKAKLVNKSLKSLFKKKDPSLAAFVIWKQQQYIAELLDRKGLFAWGVSCIGSDYDGTINPLPDIWTAEYFPDLYECLLILVNRYLSNPNPLSLKENRQITAEEVLNRFFLDNTVKFLKEFYA